VPIVGRKSRGQKGSAPTYLRTLSTSSGYLWQDHSGNQIKLSSNKLLATTARISLATCSLYKSVKPHQVEIPSQASFNPTSARNHPSFSTRPSSLIYQAHDNPPHTPYSQSSYPNYHHLSSQIPGTGPSYRIPKDCSRYRCSLRSFSTSISVYAFCPISPSRTGVFNQEEGREGTYG
jgi:hypothetical protein